MDSASFSTARLIPLTSLANQVESFQALCLSDLVYGEKTADQFHYDVIDIDAELGLESSRELVALVIDNRPHIFTKWGRSQLLGHLGTKEKWFTRVPKIQESQELNARLEALNNYRVRRMQSSDSPNIDIVRGIVSTSYADIPDVLIMESLLKALPDGYAVRHYSAKTDRAFYAYCITSDEISIPGTRFRGFPGIVVKNSEVAFTSLWVTPMIVMSSGGALVMESHVLLKKTHRGDPGELTKAFDAALIDASSVWGDLSSSLPRLAAKRFASEDLAVAEMKAVLQSSGGTSQFAYTCELAYKAARHSSHDAVRVFEAVLSVVEKSSTDADGTYVAAKLAGALLWKLTR